MENIDKHAVGYELNPQKMGLGNINFKLPPKYGVLKSIITSKPFLINVLFEMIRQ